MNSKKFTTITDVRPLTRTDLYAAYGHHQLPVVGVDERLRLLVATRDGNVAVATRANVDGFGFDEVVTR
jgi:hypothetical protein